jgi:hypothetical protein
MLCDNEETARHISKIMHYLEMEFQDEDAGLNFLNIIVGCIGYVCGNCEEKGKAFDSVRQHIDEYEEIYNRTTIDEMDQPER